MPDTDAPNEPMVLPYPHWVQLLPQGELMDLLKQEGLDDDMSGAISRAVTRWLEQGSLLEDANTRAVTQTYTTHTHTQN